MANAYTQTGSGVGVNLVQTAYEQLVAFKLRDMPLFRAVADTRATQLTNPGESVVFNIYEDLTPTTSDLTETVDPDSVALPATDQVTVTLAEMGATVIPTLKLRTLSLADIDPAVANIVARHEADSIDERVQAVLAGATNVVRSNAGAPSTSRAEDLLTDADVFGHQIPATLVAKMRGDKVIERINNTFVCFIHPDAAYDLRADSNQAGWTYPHANSDPAALWLARVGVFGGVSYIETPRCSSAAAGASSAEVYDSYILGSQALAEVVAIEPHLIIGPAVDPMLRFRPLSWYGLAGWSIYRQEAIWHVQTGSSIATF